MNDIPISALLAVLVVLLLISAFFSSSETSMMAINRYRLRHLAKHGHRGARRTARLLASTDKLLGVILLGNNLINAAVATLATVIAIRVFGQGELALGLATLGVTFVILVFSEVTPKVIGATYPEKIAFAASFVLAPLLKLAYPVVWFINLFVQGLLRLLRLRPHEDGQSSELGIEELRTLVLESGKLLPAAHQGILLNLLDLEKITVDDVMTPRSQMEAVDMEAEADILLRQLSTSHHTRLPLFRGHLDDIVGMLHVRDVAYHLRSSEFDVEALLQSRQEAYFIPSGTPLFTQLRHFQENQRRIGLVVDEYGELMGLVTLEDILEELVGEFTTQAPAQLSGFITQPDGSWLVEGASLVRSINRKLGLHLPLEGPKTLNGLVLEHLEDIPEPGTTLKISNYAVEIVQVQERAVKVARIFPIAGETDAAAS
ncbi:MAG: HlyC/CorC family transporter [Sulfuriferula sp.]